MHVFKAIIFAVGHRPSSSGSHQAGARRALQSGLHSRSYRCDKHWTNSQHCPYTSTCKLVQQTKTSGTLTCKYWRLFTGPTSGSSVDYVTDKLHVPYAFGIELRDVGRYGTLVPPEQIVPNGEESLQALKAVCSLLLNTTAYDSIHETLNTTDIWAAAASVWTVSPLVIDKRRKSLTKVNYIE